ncbi:MAG: hypothetical protein ACMG57_03875 [Candidatus Dojkabacteria bacterium]
MNRKNLLAIVGAVLLIGIVVFGVYLASQAQSDQSATSTFACNGWACGCGKCGCGDDKDITSCVPGNPPPLPPAQQDANKNCGGVGAGNTQCDGNGKEKKCSGGQMVFTGNCCSGVNACNGNAGGSTTTPTTGNSCSGSGNASACNGATVGSAHSYAQGTCTCTRTTGTLCSCVPAGGTSCSLGDCAGLAMGAACTKSGKAGVCVSQGVSGTLLTCGCQLAPATGATGKGLGATCSGNECNAGLFCNGTCQNKAPDNVPGFVCTNNNQCLSGICQGGTCVSGAGSGTGACSATNPCASGKFCNAGTCVTQKPSGGTNTCSSNSQCQSGFCISNVCRDATAGGCDGGAYKNGQWKCATDASGAKTGQGQQCSNGVFNSSTKADACAAQVTGGNCATLQTQSSGEASNGRFVGCSGALNCFCTGTTGAPNCIADSGNDSCGAGTANTGGTADQTPGATVNSTGGSGGSSTGGGTTTTTPYCGDAVCATNELCERTSAGSSTFKACSTVGGAPTGATVPACYGVQYNQPVQSTTCKWCGDGVFTPGTEQCDASAPNSGGNNPTQCDASCHLQNVANVCVSMTENGVDPIKSGASNFLQYTLIYQNNSTTNPFPNIRLLVSSGNTVATAVGRDANNTSSTLVAPIPVGGYSYDAVTSRHTYIFRWESVSTAGVAVPDATYQVRGLTDGTDAGITTSPAACTESLTASAVAVQEPLFSIIKSSAVACVDNSDATISYTVSVTNVGPVTGVVDFITDTLDPLLATAGVSPTNLNPSYGSYASGVITWTGDVSARTFTAGQTKTYTYTVVIPVGQLLNFSGGVQNLASVQYDTNTTNNNTTSFNLRTMLYCTINGIPITGIFDDGRLFLFGLIFIILGFIAYRYQLGKTISEKLISGAVSTAEEFMPFEDRIERKMEKKMKRDK